MEDLKLSIKEITEALYSLCTNTQDKWGSISYEDIYDQLLDRLEQDEKELELIHKLNIPVEVLVSEFDRLENLEDDRVQLKVELEQLEKENKELKNNCKKCIVRDRLSEYVEDSIPKSVIRDKIEELEKNRESFRSNEENSKDLNEKIFWHSQFKEMVIAINVLKETIGGINGYNNKIN